MFAYLVLFALTRCRANLLLLGAFGLNALSTAAVAARASCFFFGACFPLSGLHPRRLFGSVRGLREVGQRAACAQGGRLAPQLPFQLLNTKRAMSDVAVISPSIKIRVKDTSNISRAKSSFF